jgi:DNA invertase Pin-like site-specific DNA recombinase
MLFGLNLLFLIAYTIPPVDLLSRSRAFLAPLKKSFPGYLIPFNRQSELSPTGKVDCRLTIFASLAEFERDIIRERTRSGLNAARTRGRLGGRARGIPKAAEATAIAAETLYREGQLSVMQIAKKLSISKNTLYKYLRYRNVAISSYKPDIPKAPVLANASRRKRLTKSD